MEIRDAQDTEIGQVVQMHISAFPGFFLTTLGPGFLEHLYRGFLDHDDGVLQVAVESGALVGFAAGTNAPGHFFSSLRKRRGWAFALSALPGLVRSPTVVARKLASALSYRGDAPPTLEGALLSSLGVVPAAKGSGAGQQLVRAFERAARARGCKLVYLTTDAVGNERVNAFYRKLGYQQESTFTQSGNRSMLRYVRSLDALQAGA